MEPWPVKIGGVSFCQWHECRGCELRNDFMEQFSAEWIQALKLNSWTMSELRAVALSEKLGQDLSRMNDDEVIAQVRHFIERRGLRKCGKSLGVTDARALDPAQRASEAAIRVLEAGNRPHTLGGISYRLVRAEQWRKLRDDGGYQIVPISEARYLMAQLAAAPAISQPQRAAWAQAAEFLPQESSRRYDSGLLLLRIVPRRNFKSPTAEAAITPSQLARMVQEKHWVAIELVDEDGNGVDGIAYSIITPDNQEYTGVTDAHGLARIDNIPAGQCKISFPELDKDAYKAA
jgi:hypothetical protein